MQKNWDFNIEMKRNDRGVVWHLISSPPGAEWLFTGRVVLEVHSTYRHVVNLIHEDMLFSLHPASLARTPMSLVIDTAGREMEETGLKRGMKAEFKEGFILLNGIRIDSRKRTVWDPTLKVCISYTELGRIVSGIRQVLPDFRDRGGFSDAFVCPKRKKGDFMSDMLRSRFCAFQKRCEAPSVLATSLIGMGYGLTPSGDDFLVGLLYVLCICGCMEHKEAKEIHDAVQKNLCKTSDLSGQFLKHACAGEFGASFHGLLHAICQGEDGIPEIRRIAETGHSSGVDALNGMAAGWYLLGSDAENKPQEVQN